MKNWIKKVAAATVLVSALGLAPASPTVPSAEAGLLMVGVSVVGFLKATLGCIDSDPDCSNRRTQWVIVESAIAGTSAITGLVFLIIGKTGLGLGLVALPVQAEEGLTGLQKSMPFLAVSDADALYQAALQKSRAGDTEEVVVKEGQQSRTLGMVHFSTDEVNELLSAGNYTASEIENALSILK